MDTTIILAGFQPNQDKTPPPPDGATARGEPWPPLQCASRPLDSLLCPSIRLHPSFLGPRTRHPAISFLVFLFVLLHTAFRTSFWDKINTFKLRIICALISPTEQCLLNISRLSLSYNSEKYFSLPVAPQGVLSSFQVYQYLF